MKIMIAFIGGLIPFVFALAIAGQTVKENDDSTAAKEAVPETVVEPTEEAGPSLIGEWTLIESKVDSVGSLIVREDGTYTRSFSGGSVTGPYVADLTKPPFKLDLCVGECGAPGSEWTTIFSIFRFHSADTLELHNSPSGERFTEFAKEPDENTYLYVRKQGELKEK